MELVIFGAQGIALGIYEALQELYPARKVRCFLVSTQRNNPRQLAGLPVCELVPFAEKLTREEKKRIQVLIATPENIQDEIEELLESCGFAYRKRMTSKRWGELVKIFHARKGRFLPLAALPVGCCTPSLHVFAAKSHMDRPLKRSYGIPSYMSYIQAGAACCESRLTEVADDTGDNISFKNRAYAELTALYWIWRNKLEDMYSSVDEELQYYGFAQYRRMLQLSNDDLLRLADNDVDVVLPYPMPYEPNIHAHHLRYIKEEDWKGFLQALEEMAPEYAESFPRILQQRYLYNYNVIIAKRAVLRDYCRWLFPIFARAEEICQPGGKERGYKYLGYLGETMETLYFMYHAKDLNIVHTECRLLV